MKADLGGLDGGQLELWHELVATPAEFVLYGGVALTLRFRHRYSSDFDFFSQQEFDPHELMERLPYLNGARVLQLSANTLTCLVQRQKPVKLSFFGLPRLRRVAEPEVEEQTGLRVASTLDVAATEASVIQKRAAIRDYMDMDVLLTRGQAILEAAVLVYGTGFNPHITLKAMSFFDDGDLASLPEEVKARLLQAVDQVELENLQ